MSEYSANPKAYIEKQSEGTQALRAFEDYLKTDEGKILRILFDATQQIVDDPALLPVSAWLDIGADMFTIFEAGWKAAKT